MTQETSTQGAAEQPHATQNRQTSGQKEYSNVLRVKADPPGTTPEQRKKAVKALAGAISHGLRQYGEVHVRAIGNECVHKGAKAVSIASSFVAVYGYDLYCRPCFITTQMGDKEMTGISFLVVSSQSGAAQHPQTGQ